MKFIKIDGHYALEMGPLGLALALILSLLLIVGSAAIALATPFWVGMIWIGLLLCLAAVLNRS